VKLDFYCAILGLLTVLLRKERTLRLYLCDNHLPGIPEVSLNDFSIEKFVQYLVKGGVDGLMLYSKDHWGLAYFNTKIGKRHPTLDYDFYDEMARELRRNGVKLMTYYSVGFDNEQAMAHDDWAVREEDGVKHRIENSPPIGKWHSCCLNTPYREFCIEQVREVLSMHKTDFLFLDICKHGGYTGFGQGNLPLCYCECCKKKFKERYGVDIPGRNDFDKHRKIIHDWEMNVMDYEMVDTFTALAQEMQPGVPVMFNETVHFNERTRMRMNAHFSEGRYGSWETACITRLMNKKKAYPKSIISCHPTLTAFDPEWPARTELAVAQVTAWDGDAFIMNGPQDALGGLDDVSMSQLQDVFPKFDSCQDYIENREAIATVLLLESDLQKANDPADHSGSLVAGIKYLTYSNYPFGVITDDDLARLKYGDAKALVLPRARWLTDEQAYAVREFVRGGGLLITSSDTSMGDDDNFALADVLGVDLDSVDNTYDLNIWGSYMSVEQSGDIAETLPRTRLPLMTPLYKVRARKSAEVVARVILPCLGLEKNRWVNWFPPPPTTEVSEYPAMVMNAFGEGKCIYFASQFMDAENLNWPLAWFTKILELLLPNPPARVMSEYPEFIDATYYKKGDSVIVHCINKSVEAHGGAGVPISGGQLRVEHSLVKPTRSFAVMGEEKIELEIRRENDAAVVDLPEFKVHMLVVLE